MKKTIDFSNLTPAQIAIFNELQAQILAHEDTIKNQNKTLKKNEIALEKAQEKLEITNATLK